MYYYDPITTEITTYIPSKTGKSYLKPLTTRWLYVAATEGGSDFTLFVTYGNKKHAIFNTVSVLLLGLVAFSNIMF